MQLTPRDIEAQISHIIESPQSAVKHEVRAAVGFPLIGFASAADRLFGAPDMDPIQWLQAKYGRYYVPSQVSVISWALKMPEPARVQMGREKFVPCKDWSLALIESERLNRYVAGQIERFFEYNDIDAFSPMADVRIQKMRAERYGASVNWSEQRAAYACGLGTWGRHGNVITKIGSCVSLGSVIVHAAFPATERDYQQTEAYCQGCLACAQRCPIHAVSEQGRDVALCIKYQTMYVLPYARDQFEFEGVYGCDLCRTGVPCETCPPQGLR